MSRYASHLAGKSYGKLGTAVLEPPQIPIHGYYNVHAQERALERNMTLQQQTEVVSDPIIVLEQAQGYSYLFLSERGAVALTTQGEVRTTYAPGNFDDGIRAVLRDCGVPFA